MVDQVSGDSAESRRERLRALRQQRAANADAGEDSGNARGLGRRRAGRGQRQRQPGREGGEQGAKLRKLLADPERRDQLLERFPRLGERLQQRDGAEADESGGRQRPGGARRGRLGGGAGRRAGAGAGGGRQRKAGGLGVKGRAGRPEGGSGIVLKRKVKNLQEQVGDLTAELQETRKELQALQDGKPRARAAARKTRARAATRTKKK